MMESMMVMCLLLGPSLYYCTYVDLCKNINICGLNAKCIKTKGAHNCICEDGFIGNATTGCKLPCDEVNCGKNANCEVNGIEVACTCEQGYTLDLTNITLGCVYIKEYDLIYGPSGLCGQGTACTNLPGNFNCNCQPGFTGDPFRYCADIDECTTISTLMCSNVITCVSTPGSYFCEVIKGDN